MNIRLNTPVLARRFALGIAVIALPATLIGCSSSGVHHAGDIDSIRWNPSPAMHTLAKRDSDRLNDYARTKDSNLRMISEDIDSVFFLNRPSRLHHGVKP